MHSPKPKRAYNRHIPQRRPKPSGPGLRQLQYRSYHPDVQIYHFRPFITVDDFRTFLASERYNPDIPQDQKRGYVDMLIGPDTLETAGLFVPQGDDIPDGCIEAAYLPNIFTFGGGAKTAPGSALGFRVGEHKIEWACFHKPIDKTILHSWGWDAQTEQVRFGAPDDANRLFEQVAYIPKGVSGVKVIGANEEHKAWFDALRWAELRSVHLKVTWKGRVKALRGEQERWRREARDEEARADECVGRWVDVMDLGLRGVYV